MRINRCFRCMAETETYPCPQCGYNGEQNPDHALPCGSILNGRYLIGRVLGQGGFGITYMGWDLSLNRKLAIKEYYPGGQVTRTRRTGASLLWGRTEQAQQLRENGKKTVLHEAQKMAKLESVPEAVHVREVFQENDTAYIVMDFIEGETLQHKLKREGPMSWKDAEKLFLPLISAMGKVHAAGIIHRDLSPDNFMLQPDGQARILDLGAAKDIQTSTGASSALVVKNGFSPIEQYGTRGGSGTWTDVYAMAATIYYALTGRVPPAATDRVTQDTLRFDDASLKEIPANVRRALRRALAIQPEDRTKTMGAFLQELQKNDKSRIPLLIAAACAAVLVSVLAITLGGKTPNDPDPTETSKAAIEATTSPTTEEAESSGSEETPQQLDADVFWSLSEDGALTLSGSGVTPDYVYRDEDRPWGQTAITAVIVEDGITAIGDGLFEGAYNVKSVSLPDSVTTIGDRAFMECSSLTDITMPTKLTSLGEYAFSGCSALTEITIPQGFDTIKTRAFHCTDLQSVVIPDSVHSIDKEAFSACDSLQSVTFPDEMSEIGLLAFSECPLLTAVQLPKGCVLNNSFDDGVQITYIGSESAATVGTNVSVGDTITLGNYQGSDIEWTVLTVDGDKALLISTLALDVLPYNEGSTASDMTWENCSLRQWLNSDFLSNAFTETEQSAILTVTLSNPGYTNKSGQYIDGGNDTQDRIFLLSADEAKQFIPDKAARRAGYTAYASAQGASAYDSYGYCYWWLRSPGLAQNRAAAVDVEGNVYQDGSYVNYPYAAVRPAMWVRVG